MKDAANITIRVDPVRVPPGAKSFPPLDLIIINSSSKAEIYY